MSRRLLRVVALAALAPGLAGCVNEAAELGQPPPVRLTVARRDLVVALHDDPQLFPSARAQLRDAVTELGGAPPLAVRARILAAAAGDADAVRRALLDLGVDPADIAIEPAPGARRLRPLTRLTRTFATTRDCDAAITPAPYDDLAPSLDSLQRCVEQNSLAAMLVDPADLVDPPDLAPADAARISLIARQNAQRPTPGPAFTTQPGEPVGSYGNGVPGAAPTVPAPPAVTAPP